MTEYRVSRRFISVLIVFAILLSVCISAPAVYATGSSIGYIWGENVNVREGAGTENGKLGQLSLAKVEITGSAQGGDGYEWKKIKADTLEGYVRGDYIVEVSAETESNFEKQLSEFPESYRESLKKLHILFPNWNFVPHNLSISFDEALDKEDVFPKKLVPASYKNSLKSMGEKAYNWGSNTWDKDAGDWVAAAREVIAYYMDPRNFLDTQSIFMFASHEYDSTAETRTGVEKILEGTFLLNGFGDTSDYNGSYVDIIMAAAEQTRVSAYMIASTLRQEQGVNGTSDLISGTYGSYQGYYNFWNIGASGSTNTDVIVNGLKRAAIEGWNSRSKSIIGGALFYKNNYFAKGQNTYYYKNFDVVTGNCTHQYAQSIYDSKQKGASIRSRYINDHASKVNFIIPVYKNMWNEPAAKPVENDGKNNYYFTSLGVSGFSMYKESYSINVSGDTQISYTVPENAAYIGAESFSLNSGANTVYLTVKAESGNTNIYTLNVNAASACTLTLSGNTQPGQNATVVRGDINGDGTINAVDSAAIRLHILGRRALQGDMALRADVNGDGNINAVDSAAVRLHILGRRKLEQ